MPDKLSETQDTSEWVPVDIDIETARQFVSIMPAGRTLERLEVNASTGVLRITMDDGTAVIVTREGKPQ